MSTAHLTKEDFVRKARELINSDPDISDRELQAELEVFYLSSLPNNDPTEINELGVNLLANMSTIPVVAAAISPVNLLIGAAKILTGAAKIVATKKIDGQAVTEIINGAIIIAREVTKKK